MARFEDIGRACGKAELAIARQIGVTIGFQHRDNLPVPLKASIVGQAVGTDFSSKGKLNQTQEIRLIIPAQPPLFSGSSGFSGSLGISAFNNVGKTKDVIAGDRVEWPVQSGRYLWVDGEVEAIHNGYAYLVRATEQKTLTGGARS
jgi:hypothetical protein